jgi:ectoine hydroxylase-related dioxygenase (phytanoyl-CoA dioxygenase family)
VIVSRLASPIEEVSVSTAVGAPSVLGRDGLSRDQQVHFAEHGWVLLEEAIDPELCRACRAASDRLAERYTCGRTSDPSDRGNSTAFREPHQLEPVFYELYKTPGLLAAARQAVGHERIRSVQSITTITEPDRERVMRPEVVGDQRTWGWHRSFRPRSVISSQVDDPALIHSAMVTMGMYFVPVAPEHGVTALFDRSHTFDGVWETSAEMYDAVSPRFELVRPSAGEGSVILFSEALVHSSTPVVSEQRRYAHFAFFAVPWFNRWDHEPHLRGYFADAELRELFAPCEVNDPDV